MPSVIQGLWETHGQHDEAVSLLPEPSPEKAVQALLNGTLPSWVHVGLHPKLPLAILNYTDECQRNGWWTPETLATRGLVVNQETGEIVARPFPKFFNMGEIPQTQPERLPWEEGFRVTEKLDGRLMIMWWDPAGTPFLASRGSFTSSEAQVGTEMLRSLPNSGNLPKDITFMFEAIYPEGRVVIDYGPRKALTLLAGIRTKTGEEISWEELVGWANFLGVEVPRTYHFSSTEDLLAQSQILPSNMEGFVVRFTGGLRVKLKGLNYLELRRKSAGIGPKAVSTALRDGTFAEYTETVPEELLGYVERLADTYRKQAKALEEEARGYLAKAPSTENMRVFAAWVNKHVPRALIGPVFNLARGNPVNWYRYLR